MNKTKKNNLYNNLKVPLSIVTIAIIFQGLFERTISSFLVSPIFSKIEVNFLVDALFILIFILICVNAFQKYSKNYFVSDRLLFLSVLILLFYTYYRIVSDIWGFNGFSFYDSIKYFDIIVLFFLSLIVLKISHRNKHLSSDENKGFYLDTPLGDASPDLLNRENLAKYISIEIDNTESPNSSFAIGISSEWGFGKTSFFDLLERNMDNESNIIIKINPWINHDSKNIIKDFFNALSSKLSEYNSNISPVIKKYADILVGVGNNDFNKALNPLLKYYSQKETVLSEFEEIDSAIKSINKKLIIFIDDLDRLYKEEIIQVVKLIRNSANFGNTIFIVAYDRNYIINAIKEINSYNPEFFLEKIFQLEIRLPNFEDQIIQKRIFELLSTRVSEEDKKELLNILLKKKNSFDTNVFNSGALNTLRDATRFSNSFLLAYSYLKGEIVLADLLNIEALRLKYPGVYKLIFFQSEEYLDTASNSYQKTFYSLRTEKIKNQDGSENEKTIIKEYLDNNYDKIGVPKSDIDKAIGLLYSLFPNPDNIFYSRDVDLLSVANPSSFERYSHYRLLDTNVSEIEFSKYRAKSLEEFCSKINEWVLNGLRWELKRKFESINAFSDKDDFEKIINTIFYFARIPKIESLENDYSGFDYDNLYDKLSKAEEYVKLRYYKSVEEYQEFVVDIFKSATSPYSFDIEFIYSTFDKFSISYNFIVPKEVFEKIRLEYLNKYLSEISNFDSNIWHLYHYNDIITAISQGGNSYQIQKSKNPKATKLVIDFIKNKALDDFLFAIITKEPFDKELFAVGDIIPKMFGSFKEFEEFLDDFETTKYKYLKEFRGLLNKLEEHNYGRYVEYEFNDIPI